MTLAGKLLANLTADDLQNLLELNVGESRVIEYKAQLPETSEDGKVKFLAQVSSFANTSGGDIVFGIEADDGFPIAVLGLPGVNIDQQILRLTQLMQASIKPRLLGVEMRPVTTQAGPPCLVVRVARSLVGPHVVEHGRHWRFYGRNSAGKYPLDVGEIRAAFLAAQEITDRVRAFRAERLMAIGANEPPVPLSASDRLILHLVPASSFDARSSVPIAVAEHALMTRPLMLMDGNSTGRYTLDGCIRYSTDLGRDKTDGYVQVFRSGIIEVVRAGVTHEASDKVILPLPGWEVRMMDRLPRYITLLRELGVTPPVFVLLAFAGVKNTRIHSGGSQLGLGQFAIDRDLLIAPEAVLEDLNEPVDRSMAPAFHTLWQAGGFTGSPNFSDEGVYTRPRGA